jgi:catechol 2,3-dioxygenase
MAETRDRGAHGTPTKLGPNTSMGAVRLRVADLERVSAFYEQGVGLTVLADREGERVLGSRGRPVVELVHRPDLPPASPRSAGLYHTAILFDDRADLAAALYASATHGSGRYEGSADHIVSLAFYLRDPEGNGLELYWDRPRDQWRWTAGQLAMDSLPLDPNGFIREHHRGDGVPQAPVGASARLGHVHLKVGSIPVARAFYVDRVGFDVVIDTWPSALFVSAGGYHHHLGMNVWESSGAGRREPALGLESFEVLVDQADLEALRDRFADASRPDASQPDASQPDGEGTVTAEDPWGTRLRFRLMQPSASFRS